MPKIARYGHDRRANVKVAPDFLSPALVGRVVDFLNTAAPIGISSLADVPATLRGNLEPCTVGIDTASSPDVSVEAEYEVTEAGKMVLKEIKETRSRVRSCRECGCTWTNACVDARGPCWWVGKDLCSHCETPLEASVTKPVEHGDAKPQPAVRTDSRSGPEAGSEEVRRQPSRQSRKKSSSSLPKRVAETAPEAQITPPDAVTPIKKGHDTPLNGRQGTVIVDEFAHFPVVDNKLIGCEPHVVVVVPSRQCGKTVARDWYVRRHEVLGAAVRFLKARCILVDVVDRDAQIRKYRVSGRREAMYLEDVVALAEGLGFEAAA